MTHPLSRPFLWLLLCALFLGGCQTAKKKPQRTPNELPPEAWTALLQATKSELYSLEPSAAPPTGGKRLHGFLVLGHKSLGKSETLRLARILGRQVFEWHSVRNRCFLPRHALRVKHDGATFDFLVCYQCSKIQVYRDGSLFASAQISNQPEPLNAALKRHRLPLAKAPGR